MPLNAKLWRFKNGAIVRDPAVTPTLLGDLQPNHEYRRDGTVFTTGSSVDTTPPRAPNALLDLSTTRRIRFDRTHDDDPLSGRFAD